MQLYFSLDPQTAVGQELIKTLDDLGMGKTQTGTLILSELIPAAVLERLEQKVAAHPYRYYETSQWQSWWLRSQQECIEQGQMHIASVKHNLTKQRAFEDVIKKAFSDHHQPSEGNSIELLPWDSVHLKKMLGQNNGTQVPSGTSPLVQGLWIKVPQLWWAHQMGQYSIKQIQDCERVLQKISQSALEEPMGSLRRYWLERSTLLHWDITNPVHKKCVLKGLEYLDACSSLHDAQRNAVRDGLLEAYRHVFTQAPKAWHWNRVQEYALEMAMQVLRKREGYERHWVDMLSSVQRTGIEQAAMHWVEQALVAGTKGQLSAPVFQKVQQAVRASPNVYEQLLQNEDIKNVIVPEQQVLSLTHATVQYTYYIDVPALGARLKQQDKAFKGNVLGHLATNLNTFKEGIAKHLANYLKEYQVKKSVVEERAHVSMGWQYVDNRVAGVVVRGMEVTLAGNVLKNDAFHQWLVSSLQQCIQMSQPCTAQHVQGWCEQWTIEQKVLMQQQKVLKSKTKKGSKQQQLLEPQVPERKSVRL